MKQRAPVLVALVLGLVAFPALGLGYFACGFAPVATAAPPMPFEKTLAGAALHARLDKEMSTVAAAPDADEARLLDGARVYGVQCAVCHGALGGKKTAIAAGMFPKPPQLFDHGVDDDDPRETYWKVANGIRLTGMPGFDKTLTPAQLWNVTLVLSKKAEALPAAVQAALKAQATEALPTATTPP